MRCEISFSRSDLQMRIGFPITLSDLPLFKEQRVAHAARPSLPLWQRVWAPPPYVTGSSKNPVLPLLSHILSDTAWLCSRTNRSTTLCGVCSRSYKKSASARRVFVPDAVLPKADTRCFKLHVRCQDLISLIQISNSPSFRHEKLLPCHTPSSYLMQTLSHLAVTFPQTQNGHGGKNSPCLSLHVHFKIVIGLSASG